MTQIKKMKLYQKYIISKTNGKPIDPDAQYLVLRIDKLENDAERKAGMTYANLMWTKGEREFCGQLLKWIESYIPNNPLGGKRIKVKP